MKKLLKMMLVMGFVALTVSGCNIFVYDEDKDDGGDGGDSDSCNETIFLSLLSPADSATDQDTSVVLSWSGNAASYEVWFGCLSNNLIKMEDDYISTSYTVPRYLFNDCTYYWKVVAKKSGCDDETSEIWSFTTKGATTTTNDTYTNSIGIEMVRVEAGSFQMGSEDGYDDEKPVHSVTISQDYYIGKYEVTQAQWRAVMGTSPSNWTGDNLPVECVSWNDIQEFITKLNEMEGTDKYRLPTEAQWEFAARGGNQSQGYIYSGSNTVGDVAWNHDNSSEGTKQVGTKDSNELGLHDMSGNVREWCNDWYGAYSSGAVTDPSGADSGSYRVLRGGAWDFAPFCRVAYREKTHYPIHYYNSSGFRLASLL